MNAGLRFLNFGHFLDHYVLLIFPTAVLALESAWSMSYGAALTLGTPLFIMFSLATLPAGWLGDNWSRHHMMTLFFLGCGASCIAAGVSTGPLGLSISLGALGVFAAIYHPVGIALVTEVTHRKGHAIAVNGVCGNMGLAAAALFTGFLTESFGWRMAFLVPGGFALAAGFIYFFIHRDPARLTANSETSTHTVQQANYLWPILIFVTVAALFGGAIFNGVTLSLPKFLAERLADRASGIAQIGGYAALVFAVSGFAQLPVGWYLDRYSVKPLLIVLFTLQAVVLVIASVVHGAAIVPLSMVMVLLMFAWIPVTSWLVGTYVAPQWRSRVFSIEYTLSLGTSALVVPAIAALHSKGYGFSFQYSVLAIFALIVLAAAVFLPRKKVENVSVLALQKSSS